MYSFKRIKDEVYVIHNKSGVTLKYKTSIVLLPEYFDVWFLKPKTERQMLYQQFLTNEVIKVSVFSTPYHEENIYDMILGKKEEKDTPMFRSDTNIEITQRNFILASLQDAWYQKDTLKKDFYLEDDTPPRTAKDVIKRITDGLYVLPQSEYADEENDWECPFSAIRWRDPAKKEDMVGYKAALEQRKADFEAAKSTIILKDIVAGQAALEEFKAKKYN